MHTDCLKKKREKRRKRNNIHFIIDVRVVRIGHVGSDLKAVTVPVES
jgi:hypothetical protein